MLADVVWHDSLRPHCRSQQGTKAAPSVVVLLNSISTPGRSSAKPKKILIMRRDPQLLPIQPFGKKIDKGAGVAAQHSERASA